MTPLQVATQVVDQIREWVPIVIAIAIALGPAWVVFRSRAMKEELKLLREQVGMLKGDLARANGRIDQLQRENTEAVASRLLAVFEREGLFGGGVR